MSGFLGFHDPCPGSRTWRSCCLGFPGRRTRAGLKRLLNTSFSGKNRCRSQISLSYVLQVLTQSSESYLSVSQTLGYMAGTRGTGLLGLTRRGSECVRLGWPGILHFNLSPWRLPHRRTQEGCSRGGDIVHVYRSSVTLGCG